MKAPELRDMDVESLRAKTQKRTSTFVAHDEKNEAKSGDTVVIAESRPLSKRKRWALVRIVERAGQ